MDRHLSADGELQISVTPCGGDGVRVTVVGEVDYLSAPRLRSTLWWVLAEFDPRRLTVDLSGVPFLDSTGRGALLYGWRQAHRQDCRFTVAHPQPRVLAMLRLAGVAGHLGLDAAAPGGKA